MTPLEIRRLSMFALPLVCLPGLAASGLHSLAASEYHGVQPAARIVGIEYALVPFAALLVLICLAWWRPAKVERVFTPSGLDGAGLIGCALIRVFCLRSLVAELCDCGMEAIWVAHAGGGLGPSGITWVVCLLRLLVAAVPLLFFFAAPGIARWVVAQVDSSVMWWTSLLRWATR